MSATQSQTETVIEHIKQHGSINAMEALSQYGIMRLAARVMDARESGVPIMTVMVSGRNRYGEAVRYADYRMAAQ